MGISGDVLDRKVTKGRLCLFTPAMGTTSTGTTYFLWAVLASASAFPFKALVFAMAVLC